MMRGLKKDRVNKFKYYLRLCDKCGEFFESQTKLRRLCPNCKAESNREKVEKSLVARGIIKITMEVKTNELNESNSNNRELCNGE